MQQQNWSQKKPGNKVVKVLFVLMVFALGYVGGVLGAANASSDSFISILQSYVDNSGSASTSRVFTRVIDEINNNYFEQPVDEQALLYGALEGLVKSLGDPYSVFFEPSQAQLFQELVEGSFEGIGAEIGIRDERLTIIAPLKGSPALAAGALAGDFIVTIDGQNTDGLTLDHAVSLLRGEKGTQVVIEVIHADSQELDTIEISRDTISIESVTGEIQTMNGVPLAYIEISSFTGLTTSEFDKVLQELLLAGPKAIIIDLRNNPGGFLDSAIEISGYYIGDKVAVIEEFNNGEQLSHAASGSGALADLPTAVLVNRGSASASEIVAGALRDNNQATIIGQSTFGKGSVQNFEEFSDGSSLKLTVAHWLTPNGTSIDGDGIVPDIEVEYTVEEAEAGLDPQLVAAQQEVVSQCCNE